MIEKLPNADFFANELCFLCHMAEGELHYFNHFHGLTELSWAKKSSEIEEQLRQSLKKHAEQHHQDIIEDYSWELHQHQDKFPNIHRESLIITI